MDTNDKHEEMTVLEGEKLIENHEYDGIHELDNSPPPWLLGIWWVTLAFAIVFLLYYYVFGGLNQYEKYDKAMAKANEQVEQVLAGESAGAPVAVDLEKGKKIFITNCVNCHGNLGEGMVGPNLTDNYWIHGGTFDDLVLIIMEGVPAKGMIPWKTQMSGADIQQVAHYILSLQGTNPPNAKAPEGQQMAPQQ